MMEPRHTEIRTKVDEAYAAIKKAESDLEILRASCDHPETHEALWQWGGLGHHIPAILCKVCDQVINSPFNPIVQSDFNDFDEDFRVKETKKQQ